MHEPTAPVPARLHQPSRQPEGDGGRVEQLALASPEETYRSWMATAQSLKTEASMGITYHQHLARELHEAGDYQTHAFHKLIEQWWTQQFVAAEDLIGNLYRTAPASYR